MATSGTDADAAVVSYEIYLRRYKDNKKKDENRTFESIYKGKLSAKKRCNTDEVSFSDAESLRCSVIIDGVEQYIAATNKDYKLK